MLPIPSQVVDDVGRGGSVAGGQSRACRRKSDRLPREIVRVYTRERLRNEKDFDYMRGNAWIGRELECVDAMRFRTEMSEVTAAFRDPWLA